jgi:DNA-binding PadR family transcriptional regulator
MGAVYTALDRLEQKGFVRSRLGSSTPKKGGRRKRFYEVTGTGLAALSTVQSTRGALLELIEGHPQLGFGR